MTPEPVIGIPLGDGTWIALEATALAAARRRAGELGLTPAPVSNTAPAASSMVERWLDSREMAAATGISDGWWEGAAKRGEVPHMRAGKHLRFRLSDVAGVLKARHADRRTAR